MKLPELIHPDYKPSLRVFELGLKQGMSAQFIHDQVPEFIFWYQEKEKRRKNWDLAFWNWCKKGWQWKKPPEGRPIPKDYVTETVKTPPIEEQKDRLKRLRESAGI